MKKDLCFFFYSHQPDVLNFLKLFLCCFAVSSSVKYLQYKILGPISNTKFVFLTFVNHTTVYMRLIYSFVKYCQLIIFKFANLHTQQLGTSCYTCHRTMLPLHLVYCVDKTVNQQQLPQRSGYFLMNSLPGSTYRCFS